MYSRCLITREWHKCRLIFQTNQGIVTVVPRRLVDSLDGLIRKHAFDAVRIKSCRYEIVGIRRQVVDHVRDESRIIDPNGVLVAACCSTVVNLVASQICQHRTVIILCRCRPGQRRRPRLTWVTVTENADRDEELVPSDTDIVIPS